MPHPLAKGILQMLAGLGTRAVAGAVDSVLADAEVATGNANKRVRKARKKLKKIPRIEVEAEDEGE